MAIGQETSGPRAGALAEMATQQALHWSNIMRTRNACLSWYLALGLLAISVSVTQAQVDMAFTYQGVLKDSGAPVTDSVYFMFTLWDAESEGTQIDGEYITPQPVAVENGLFTVQIETLYFGSEAFDGSPRWIQIAVQPAGSGTWTELSPRQPLTAAPYALYAFDGPGGGGSLWESSGMGDIYYTDGNVGVGTEEPGARLHVASWGDPALMAENWGSGDSVTLAGPYAGVSASTFNPNGAGVYASNLSFDTGICAAIWAYTPNPNGYAGYFDGRGYFSEDVGIGRIPTAKFDVAGTVKVDGFQLTSSPVAGYVLTADASGVGTWQPGGGGSSLWTVDAEGITYQAGNVGIGCDSDMYARLYVDSGGQKAIHAHNSHPSAQTFALYAEADSTMARTVFADATSTSGQTLGVLGRAMSPDGCGVLGDATAVSGTATGVWGRSSSLSGYGVHGEAPTTAVLGEATGTIGTPTGVWGQSSSSAGYGVRGEAPTTGVFGQATGSSGRGVYGYASATSGQAAGIFGETGSPDGYGVWGYNDDDGGTGTAIGVYGSTNSTTGTGVKGYADAPDGFAIVGHNAAASGSAIGVYGQTGHAEGFAGYFLGRGYFNGNVGIGTTPSTSKLGVAGVIESLSGGFKFPDGTIQTTAGGGGGESLWQQNGDEIFYDIGNVGIGVNDPETTLHVAGGNWDVANGEGDFKIGTGTYRLKMGVDTTGGEAGECRIFAGGPSSKLILGANGAERVTVTSTEVDVAGALEVDSFQLTDSPSPGFVLTCDAAGNGTWQEPSGGGGFDLPYAGAASTTGTAFSITNTGTGAATAISATLENATSADASAGTFRADGCAGYAIYASSDDTTIRAKKNGPGGNVVYATSAGGGGFFRSTAVDGYGVKGEATALSGSDTIGGWFDSQSSHGKAVYAEASGDYGTALLAEATGGEGYAIMAESSWVGIQAKGPVAAAKFFGNIDIYEYGTYTKVLELGKGLDYAEGFDVSTDDAQIGPGTVLVIDPQAPGKLAISTQPYDRKVAGIVAGANGLGSGVRLGGDQFDHDVALAGRVYCNVMAHEEPIEPGDLLTTSSKPGWAMKVMDHQRAQGAIIGKAMEPLAANTRGQIMVLVTLQ